MSGRCCCFCLFCFPRHPSFFLHIYFLLVWSVLGARNSNSEMMNPDIHRQFSSYTQHLYGKVDEKDSHLYGKVCETGFHQIIPAGILLIFKLLIFYCFFSNCYTSTFRSSLNLQKCLIFVISSFSLF